MITINNRDYSYSLEGSGGGSVNSAGKITMFKCNITYNLAYGTGGGLEISGDVYMTFCRVEYNWVTETYGGGCSKIHIQIWSTMHLNHTTK